MPSSANVVFKAGLFEDGLFSLVPSQPPPAEPPIPATIPLGVPGAPLHLLPMRMVGGSITDLDLLYGMLNQQAWREDIEPIFALCTRAGAVRAFGRELPRQGILDETIEAYATLLEVEDVSVEGAGSGTNLFGYVGLAQRPQSSVRLSNADGYWTALVLRELLLNAPAGLYVDVGHQVVAAVQVGTVTDYEFVGPDIVITYGFATRRQTPTGRD